MDPLSIEKKLLDHVKVKLRELIEQPLTEVLWQILCKHREWDLEDIRCNEDAEDVAELMAEDAELLIEYENTFETSETDPRSKSGIGKKHTMQMEVNRQLSDIEQLHANALSFYFVNRAEQYRGLIDFRNSFLGGNLLSEEQSIEFLESPACRLISTSDFRKYEIPYLGHTAIIKSKETDWDIPASALGRPHRYPTLRINRYKVFVDPPGRIFEAETSTYIETKAGKKWFDIYRLLYKQSNSTCVVGDIARMSVLYELWELVNDLMEDYGFMEEDLPLFVLSGKQPRVSPIHYSDLEGDWARGTITMRVAPWVSSKSVKRAYMMAQKVALGCEARTTSEKIISLFRFITVIGEPKNQSQWQTRYNEWNTMYPKWHYDSLKQFRRDYYYRGKKKLVSKHYWERLTDQ
ncbi:MAG: hypothetical protein ABFD83_05625 [Armatimonadota bacterium]